MADPFYQSNALLLGACSIAYILTWQILGASLLQFVFFRNESESKWAHYLISWYLWPFFCGFAGLSIVSLGLSSRYAYLTVSAFIFVGGILACQHLNKSQFDRKSSGLVRQILRGSVLSNILVYSAICVQVVRIFFTALPHLWFDQMNYHLEISKRVFEWGSLRPKSIDVHFFISGLYEYGLVFPRSLLPSDLFQHSCGQVWTYLANGPVIIGMLVLLTKKFKPTLTALAFILGCFLFPNALGGSLLFSVFKPDAFLFTAVFLVCTSYFLLKESAWLQVALALAILPVGFKITYIPSSLAVGIGLLLFFIKNKPKLNWSWLPAFALLICLVALIKNYVFVDNPVYPAFPELFPSPYSNAESIQYWRAVAFRRTSGFWDRFLGIYDSMFLYPQAWAWFGVFLLYRFYREYWLPASFLVIYFLLWPVNLGRFPEARFIAPMAGMLFASGFCSAINGIHTKAIFSVATLIAISTSGVERYLTKNAAYLLKPANQIVIEDIRSYQLQRLLDRENVKDGRILSNITERFYLELPNIYVGNPVSSDEQRLAKGISTNPLIVMREFNIVAIVKADDLPFPNWDKLTAIEGIRVMNDGGFSIAVCRTISENRCN